MAEADNLEEDLFADLYVLWQRQSRLRTISHRLPGSGLVPPDDLASLYNLAPLAESQAHANKNIFLNTILHWPTRSYTEDDAPAKPEPTPVVRSEPAAPVEVKSEVKPEESGDVDQTMYAEEEEEDDEIDFNLGNGNSYEPSANHESQGTGIKEDG